MSDNENRYDPEAGFTQLWDHVARLRKSNGTTVDLVAKVLFCRLHRNEIRMRANPENRKKIKHANSLDGLAQDLGVTLPTIRRARAALVSAFMLLFEETTTSSGAQGITVYRPMPLDLVCDDRFLVARLGNDIGFRIGRAAWNETCRRERDARSAAIAASIATERAEREQADADARWSARNAEEANDAPSDDATDEWDQDPLPQANDALGGRVKVLAVKDLAGSDLYPSERDTETNSQREVTETSTDSPKDLLQQAKKLREKRARENPEVIDAIAG